jgi:chorismate dehydratase
LREIAEAEAGKSGLTVDDLFRYFRENLHFEMGPQQWEGLRSYHEGLIESGLIWQSPAVTAG